MNLFKRIKRYIDIHLPTEKNATKRIISFWEKGGADFDYYTKAEQEHWIKVFWDEKSIFYTLFQKLNTNCLLEIACGTGRHSAKVIDKVKVLYLLDSSEAAIELAREKFSKDNNRVNYIHSKDGLGIPEGSIPKDSLTAIFSYDAMVHFEKEAVEMYLKDSYRVLKPDSFALMHHSNYDKNPNGKFSDNPGWRNFMTQHLFKSMATKYGFEIVHSEVIAFACPDSDCITLLKKPL